MQDITISSTALQFYAQVRSAITRATLDNGFKTAGDPWGDYLPGTLPEDRNGRAANIFLELPSEFRQQPYRDDVFRMVNACVLGAST
jgi:hypothetical protein